MHSPLLTTGGSDCRLSDKTARPTLLVVSTMLPGRLAEAFYA